MKTFDLKNLDDWRPVTLQDAIKFPVGYNARQVVIKFNASHPVSVFAEIGDKAEKLLCSGDGLMLVKVSISEAMSVRVVSHDPKGSPNVLYKTLDKSQVVSKISEEKFTSLERRRQVNPELARMQALMRYNYDQLEAKTNAAIARMEQTDEAVIEASAPKTISDAPAANVSSATSEPVQAQPVTDDSSAGIDPPPVETVS